MHTGAFFILLQRLISYRLRNIQPGWCWQWTLSRRHHTFHRHSSVRTHISIHPVSTPLWRTDYHVWCNLFYCGKCHSIWPLMSAQKTTWISNTHFYWIILFLCKDFPWWCYSCIPFRDFCIMILNGKRPMKSSFPHWQWIAFSFDLLLKYKLQMIQQKFWRKTINDQQNAYRHGLFCSELYCYANELLKFPISYGFFFLTFCTGTFI